MKYEKLEIEAVEFEPGEVDWKAGEVDVSKFSCPIGKFPYVDFAIENESEKSRNKD